MNRAVKKAGMGLGTELVEKAGDYSFPRKVFYADGLFS
jgi:hypothetical protein